ncbi:putative hydrolase [Gluconacetobacter sacchari DSM 12717]|uniref:Alpha/beta hydrolase n=2 Tax=Gluconacetobacter sacchari TaxID=92759 RepID=A0A7W4IDI0_9PROT|nr:alpha/beta hydrolase [Gluconacetobacter sacchari]MBB2160762.1 alpha/beta hydrolase [Gluconacetobacter sacchari]GBQ29187.1 putative hydrolase [Gluconacetobacter sacchari DSM 12717]
MKPGRLIRAAWLAAAMLAAPAAAGTETPARFDDARRIASLPDGIDMAYIDRGPRDGRPVILVHGYTDSARDWLPALSAFAPRDRLILIDLRGHGHSSKPECCYALVDFAWDIRLLMERLGLQRADLVGHSLGSLVVQVFAENRPDRVKHVVLIASTGGLSPTPTPRERAGRTAGFDSRTPISRLREPIDPDSAFMRA